MIDSIRIVNFRQIEDVTIEFTSSVVIVGPNNGGKTTALQAISLLGVAIRRWASERLEKNSKASKRTGVAIQLDELLNIPISEANQIWRNLTVREGIKNEQGKPTAKNIKIEIHAKGSIKNQAWHIGFEFDYGRDTLIYARLTTDPNTGNIYEFPSIILEENIGYLPSISGLSLIEDKLEMGSVFRLIGQGKTADVLRNICYNLYSKEDKSGWATLTDDMYTLFRIRLDAPRYNTINGTLSMTYQEDGRSMDLSSLGSGAKQALLLFVYILAFPNSINLLDEPDSHLEVIRQSSIYDKISGLAKSQNAQIIIASHSESVLERAFSKDTVISAVLGQFETVNNKKYLKASLNEIGYEQFLIARQRPCLLYLEGSTDFDFIKAFAEKIGRNDIRDFLETNVFFHPVANDVNAAIKHFTTIKEFVPNLKGFALFDNLKKEIFHKIDGLEFHQWGRNEIENYLTLPQAILTYFKTKIDDETSLYYSKFEKIIQDYTTPIALKDPNDRFWKTTKISDDYLTEIFRKTFTELGLPMSTMDKSRFYQFVQYCNSKDIDREVFNVLDNIYKHLQQ